MLPQPQTYVDLLHHIEQAQSNPKALNYHDDDGIWHATSTDTFLASVKAIALGLRSIGLERGDRVGILAPPSPNWTAIDMATVIAGGVIVPIFATIADDNFIFEVTETKLKIMFIDGVEQWNLFKRFHGLFEKVIAMGKETPAHEKVTSLAQLIEAGNALDNKEPDLYTHLKATATSHDLAAIFYTSGSTGIPKGVELTQLNLIAAANFHEFALDEAKDRYLSILPLEHVFGHCFNLWTLYQGIPIYYSHDYKHLVQVCREVQPTVIAVVPRLLERVYAKMLENLSQASFFKRKIGRLAFLLAHQKHSSLLKTMITPLLDKLVYAKLRQALGGKIRVLISGGAPLSARLQHFFYFVGMPIYQGWGLTEACPLSTTTPMHDKLGTVGKALPGQEIIISGEGEILVRGSLVMQGYYGALKGKCEFIDEQGFLHTGDKGKLDAEGFLTIIGRSKELYKTSTGELVLPVPMEQALCRYPLIDMAMVIAEGHPFVSCLLFPNMEVLAKMKSKANAEKMDDRRFLEGAFVQGEIKKLLQEVNQHVNHYAQIRDYRFVLEPITIKGGELTPSMKMRREEVAKKFSGLIFEMYKEEL